MSDETAFPRSRCPIATTLDIVGDKWTLIVLRDMFAGKKRFSDFLESPEPMKRSILTDRLKRLESTGLIRRERYQRRPDRYEYFLTRSGAELLPVLQAIARWGMNNREGVWQASDRFLAWTADDFVRADP